MIKLCRIYTVILMYVKCFKLSISISISISPYVEETFIVANDRLVPSKGNGRGEWRGRY